jgi:hypothetical protein
LCKAHVKCNAVSSLFFLHTLAPMSSGPITDEHGAQRWYDGDGKLHRDGDLPAVVALNGDQGWYQHGACHRSGDLPAVVWTSGLKRWFQHGKQHRDGDLPALKQPDGTQAWYQHGKLHRGLDLPAVVWANGRQEWWVNGVCQTSADRRKTRRAMVYKVQAARWSPLRAAFVGACLKGT